MAEQNTNRGIVSFLIVQLLTCLATAHAINCPINCKCGWVLDSLEVDCSRRGLIDYPAFDNMPIEHLDLSGNYLIHFHKQLADIESLIYLDLSNNQIEYLDADALLGFTSLRTLLLSNNSIKSWASISPNQVFRNAISLKHLSLSGNHLSTFTDGTPKDIIRSESLSNLELEKCGITTVNGDLLMIGVPNLERLSLSGNAITTLSALPSNTLRVLELSNCHLPHISPLVLQGLPNLEALNLSWNTGLQLSSKRKGNIISLSLNELDVTFCNIDEINLSGLPSLTSVYLRGNMLRAINIDSFANNTQLEIIDLARNSLRMLEVDAFSKLKRLTKIDLSYNEIAQLDRNLFRSNDVLVSLNLSRNVIEKFTKLVSNSLRDINLSWCEIIGIDGTAFSGLLSVQRLDLSNNLIKEFPSGMRSETLQILDLSNCRLSAVRNNTFREFPELFSLHLVGNRFTNPFSAQYFRSNKYLDQIWIGDNPWICNCEDTTFVDFYGFLTTKPQKLKDKNNVRCASPSIYYGKTWETACLREWLPSEHTNNAEKVWTTIMLSLLAIGAVLFFLTCFRKYMKSRKQRTNRSEFRQNQEEMQEIRRQNQRMLEEEGAPNAPTMFETNLPSYEDAILMPKLERPVKSMVDLSASNHERKKLRRSRTDPEQENDDLLLDNMQRFRSEEMLSNRAKERTLKIDPCRRTGHIEHNNSGSRRFSIEDSRFPPARLKSQNLQSAEQIGNFQSYENSPYTKRKPQIAEIPPFKRATLRADSVEFLTDPEFDATSKPSSPFARRKPRLATQQSKSTHGSSANTLQADAAGALLDPAIEDYFGTTQKSTSNSTTGSDYQVLVEADVASLPDGNCSSSLSSAEMDLELNKRKKRKNSSTRRASGNFTAAAAAAGDTSSSDKEPMVVVHKPMRETLF